MNECVSSLEIRDNTHSSKDISAHATINALELLVVSKTAKIGTRCDKSMISARQALSLCTYIVERDKCSRLQSGKRESLVFGEVLAGKNCGCQIAPSPELKNSLSTIATLCFRINMHGAHHHDISRNACFAMPIMRNSEKKSKIIQTRHRRAFHALLNTEAESSRTSSPNMFKRTANQ